MPFVLLYVCTGNVCRSPMAELFFRAWASPVAEVEVASAGMAALVGEPIDASSAAAIRELGIDTSQHRARQFVPWMAERADLVLTAERAHRDQVMTAVPAGFRRIFAMKEFARLARHVPSGSPRDVVARLSRLRGIDGGVPPEADDVPDPYRGDLARARAIAHQVSATVHATIAVLGMGPAGGATSTPQPAPAARRPLPYRR